MNEQLLQYLWNFKIFTKRDFKDIQGNSVEILDFGQWNKNAGPDFLFAKIKTKGLIFSGHIELHVHSSDWDLHQHSNDPSYQNVILHVVFKHDKNIIVLEQKNIPTLALEDYINPTLLQKYEAFQIQRTFIPCEDLVQPHHIPIQFHEENLIKKLDEKSIHIENLLEKTKNDYEAVLFQLLAYNFGLKINAPIFAAIAENIEFNIIRKISRNQIQLESLLLGKAGFLIEEFDETATIWKKEYHFLKTKFNLNDVEFKPQFSKLRPANFPTIRLSQLSNLYHQHTSLFSEIIEAKDYSTLISIFNNIKASPYWDHHYQIGKISEQNHPKILTKEFIHLLLINTILPIQYTYFKNTEPSVIEDILHIYQNIPVEKNRIVDEWKSLKIKIKNSVESQSLLYHYKNYCLEKKCLNCSIGLQILKP